MAQAMTEKATEKGVPMENKNISKKIPIALGIAWLAFVNLTYVASMIFSIAAPQTYLQIIDGWMLPLYGVIIYGISGLLMAAIMMLAKKAQIKWMHIVAKIHLFVDVGFTLIFGICVLVSL